VNIIALLRQRYGVTQNPAMALRRLEAVSLCLGLLLFGWALLGMIAHFVGSGPSPILPTAESLAVKPLELEQPLSNEGSKAVLARPLFWESRRPLDAEPLKLALPKEKPNKVQRLEGVTLHGVFGAGESLGVIATVNGKLQRVSGNQTIKGWQLESYSSGIAVFANSGRKQSLPLELASPTVSIGSKAVVEPTEGMNRKPMQQMTERDEAAEQARRQYEQEAERERQEQVLGFGGSAQRGKKQ
jgi:hypothetical protein